jgi:hypothetical protein
VKRRRRVLMRMVREWERKRRPRPIYGASFMIELQRGLSGRAADMREALAKLEEMLAREKGAA